MPDEVTIKDGYMYGAWRQMRNVSHDHKGSIHDEVTAQKLGMRGGVVAGANHLDLYPPLLIKAFGQCWFEQGVISVYYTYATLDREDVRAVVGVPDRGAGDVQVETWIETPDGKTVGKGTVASGNPKEPSYIQSIEFKDSDRGELRMLAGLKPGDELPPREVIVTQEEVNQRLEVTTDPLGWYQGDSPWGGSILPPRVMFNALHLNPVLNTKAVGFLGASEIRNINGPIKVGVRYLVTGRIVFVGTSPKTEYCWYDSCMYDMDGRRIAEMRRMSRFMKASSPFYQDSMV